MSADPNVPWNLVAQVRRSDRRTQIVKHLAQDPASASELGKKLGVKTSTASNYLYDLKTMDPPVVVCITPDQPHHRLYALTGPGTDIVEHI